VPELSLAERKIAVARAEEQARAQRLAAYVVPGSSNLRSKYEVAQL
jgi:hypothetical protein